MLVSSVVKRVLRSAIIGYLFLFSLVQFASAQEQPVRVFLRFSGSEADVEALSQSATRFRAPILEETDIAFAGTAEMDEVYTQCREAIGVGPVENWECRVEAARRLSMDELLEVGAVVMGEGAYELTLTVWDTASNTRVYESFVEVHADSVASAGRAGLAALAERYLCYAGWEDHCGDLVPSNLPGDESATVLPTHGRLEVLDVTPSPVTVFVDGREVGIAPGQFLDLPLAEVEVTLRATGYYDLTQMVTLTAERMAELHGQILQPYPATLAIECNVEEAEVRVSDELVGMTLGGEPIQFQVSPGEQVVTVSRYGYVPARLFVNLVPGTTTAIEVNLDQDYTSRIEDSKDGDALGSVILLSTGAGLVAFGFVWDLATRETVDEFRTLSDSCQTSCSDSNTDRLYELQSSLETDKIVVGVTMGVGAAAILTAFLWRMIDDNASSSPSWASHEVVTPYVSQSGAGISLDLTW